MQARGGLERREGQEREREADRRAVLLGDERKRERARPEQRIGEAARVHVELVLKLLVESEATDELQQQRDVVLGGGSDHARTVAMAPGVRRE